MQMGMHGLDSAFNGLCLSGKGYVTRCVFTENGCCCLHRVLPSPIERSSPVYSFQPDLKRQTNANRSCMLSPSLLLRRLFRLHVRSCIGSHAHHIVEHARARQSDIE